MSSLNLVCKKLLKSRLTRLKDWSEEKAISGINAYETFLNLKADLKDVKDTKLSPPLRIAEVWHLHILDTERYAKDCEEFCGETIHHDIDGDIDEVKFAIRMNATKIAYQMKFGSEPTGEMWVFDEVYEQISNKVNVNPNAAEMNMIPGEHDKTDSSERGGESNLIEGNLVRNERAEKRSLVSDDLEGRGKLKIIEVDAVKRPKVWTMNINYGNRRRLKVKVTEKLSFNYILMNIAKKWEFSDYQKWKIRGKNGVFLDLENCQKKTMKEIKDCHGLNWFITADHSQKVNGKEFEKKGSQNIDLCLLPQSDLLPTYTVKFETPSKTLYKVNVTKATSTNQVLEALPYDKSLGRWVLQKHSVYSRDSGIAENCVTPIEFVNWARKMIHVVYIGKKFTFSIGGTTTVKEIKTSLENSKGIPECQQQIMLDGMLLLDEQHLGTDWIPEGATFQLFLRL